MLRLQQEYPAMESQLVSVSLAVDKIISITNLAVQHRNHPDELLILYDTTYQCCDTFNQENRKVYYGRSRQYCDHALPGKHVQEYFVLCSVFMFD